MGGFIALPGALAAFFLRVPVFLQEQNSTFGTTTKICLPLAKLCFTGFPMPPHPKLVFTGNPLRQNFEKKVYPPSIDRPLRILSIGGSQGARSLCTHLPQAVAQTPRPIDLWMQTGAKNLEITQKYAEDLGIENVRIHPFIEDMEKAYHWADLIVARSGAITVSEIVQVGLASLLIPYPYATDDHQRKHAMLLVEKGGALLLNDDDRLTESLTTHLASLDYDTLKTMGKQTSLLAQKEAAKDIIARRIIAYIKP